MNKRTSYHILRQIQRIAGLTRFTCGEGMAYGDGMRYIAACVTVVWMRRWRESSALGWYEIRSHDRASRLCH